MSDLTQQQVVSVLLPFIVTEVCKAEWTSDTSGRNASKKDRAMQGVRKLHDANTLNLPFEMFADSISAQMDSLVDRFNNTNVFPKLAKAA